MRVGLVIYGSLDTLSGGYLYDRKLVERLRAHGDEVQVIARPWRGYARHLSDNLSPGWRQALRQALCAAQVDVLLQDELNHASLAWANPSLRRRPCPIVTIVHHLRISEQRPAWQNSLYRLVERRYLNSVDGFIFNSQTTRRAVEAAGANLQGRPWCVAYPAGDAVQPDLTASEIAQRCAQPGPLRLIFAGNLIPRKGLHTLLQALERLPEDACRLVVVGREEVDPAYSLRIRRMLDNSPKLRRAVQLTGRLSDSELRQALRVAQVMALPSQYEGFGIVYLEGMGFGLPAVGSTAGAAHEIITHGVDGFLAQPEDPAGLAELVWQLASDRGRLLQMALAAQARYLQHPTWQQSMDTIVNFLHRLTEPQEVT